MRGVPGFSLLVVSKTFARRQRWSQEGPVLLGLLGCGSLLGPSSLRRCSLFNWYSLLYLVCPGFAVRSLEDLTSTRATITSSHSVSLSYKSIVYFAPNPIQVERNFEGAII